MREFKEKIGNWFKTYELTDKHAILLLIFSVTLFFSPLLFFGKILLNADATYYAYPVAYFFSHYFGQPINHFLFSGYPVADAFQIGYFHPLYNFFYFFFDFIFAYHFLLFLDFAGAAIFTYLFTRKIGLSVYASLIASMAYTFCQFSIAWLGVPSMANAVFLLPAVLYCVLQISELKKSFIFIFGLIVGVAFLATHYQLIVMSLLASGVFFTFEMWQRWTRERSLSANLKFGFFFCLGILIALLISLPQALHSLNFFGQSTRVVILMYFGAQFIDIIKYFIPTWNIINISLTEFRPYIGIAPLFFALVGSFAIYKKKIIDKRASFFLWFFVVTFIMTLQYSPVTLIVKHLPFIKFFTDQSRWIYLTNFSLIIVGAFGFDFALKNPEVFYPDKVRKFFKWFLVCLTSLFILINLTLLFFGKKIIILILNYFDLHLYAKTTHLPLKYYHDIIELMVRKSFLNVSFLNPNVVLFILFMICLYFLLKISNRKVFFSNMVVLFVFVNMLAVSSLTYDLSNKSILLEKSHLAEFIHTRESSPEDYRVFGFAVPFGQYQKITAIHPEAEKEATIFAKEALMANLNVFSDTPIVGGYDPLAFRRYQDIVTLLEDTTARKTTDEKISLFLTQLNLLSAMNVKYIVSPYELKSNDLDLVFSEKVTSFNVPLYLYENKKVLPRFYLAKNVALLSENDEAGSFAKVTGAKSDFKDVTFIECDKCLTSTGNGTATSVSQNANNIEISTKSNSDQYLVLSNEAVPGWQATVDGNSTRIYYANHAYMAVQVPKGEHKVVFSYNTIPKFGK